MSPSSQPSTLPSVDELSRKTLRRGRVKIAKDDTQAKLNRLRERGKRDLYFLCTEILGYTALTTRVHQPICDFFVQKDCSKGLYEQDEIKNRLLLFPRGHFKTTIDIADKIQWILNFPDIRILFMSGKLELAERMVYEMKQHFMANSKFREIYPEFCPPQGADFGTTTEFVVPNRTVIKREPTVSISTTDSIKAGSHYDLIACDDLVNEVNSLTREQIEKVIEAYHYTTPLLDPGGYRDVIGTRYDYSDLYGSILKGGTKDYLTLVRSAWAIRPDGTRDILFPERFCDDDSIHPHKSNLSILQRDNPYLFNCQYLNNPVNADTQHFTIDLMRKHIIPLQQVPGLLRYYMAWDLGFTAKSTSDFSVGAIGGYDSQGRLFITDIIRGRFAPSQIVDMVYHGYKKWPVRRVGIEDAGGSALLGAAIDARARSLRTYMPVDWIKVKRMKDAKINRVEGLEALLREDKLYFSNSIGCLEDLLAEFTMFPKYKHDDICDAVAHLLNYRTMIDFDVPESQVELVTARVYSDDPILGCGFVG